MEVAGRWLIHTMVWMQLAVEKVPGLRVHGNLEGVAQGRDALCTFFPVLLPHVSGRGCGQRQDFGLDGQLV